MREADKRFVAKRKTFLFVAPRVLGPSLAYELIKSRHRTFMQIFLNMSRQISCRYLLYYLSVSAILACGSSQRLSRRSSCPSCSQDCPEALGSYGPWYPRRELNPQAGASRDFSVAPFQNPLHLIQRGNFQNIAREGAMIPLNQNLMSYQNYRNLPRQESAKRYPYVNVPSIQFVDNQKRQNVFPSTQFFENFPGKVVGLLDEQEIYRREQPERRDNSFVGIPPAVSTRIFGKSGHENLFLRNPRNKYSMRSSEAQEDAENAKEDPASKLLIVHPANRNPLWKDSKLVSSNLVSSRKPFAMFRGEDASNVNKKANEEFPKSISQQFNLALAPQEGYYPPTGFDASKETHNSHIPSQNLDIEKQLNGEFLGNLDITKDFLETSNLEQSKQSEDNFFETYPVEEKETFITGDNNEQINYNPYVFSEDQDIPRPMMDEESLGDWNIAIQNTQKPQKIGQFKEFENNWPQSYPVMEKDTHFEDDEDQEYFKEIEKNIAKAIDPYSQNIWRAKQGGELHNVDFTMPKNSQVIQKIEKSEIHPVEKNTNKYFHHEENKDKMQDEIHANTDGIMRAPINGFSMFPRFLNILKTPNILNIESISKESPEMKNNLSRSVGKKDEKPYKDEIVTSDIVRTQDLIFSKNTFGTEKYDHTVDRKPYTKDNAQNKPLTEFDPDLMDDVEDPPTEPTQPTLIESLKFSTPGH